jgi:hypothetical protein
VVNTAFVLLLNALTERKADMRLKGYRWLPNRDVFKIFKSLEDSGTKDSNKLLEARTDGCFRHTESNLSAAIVEVKPSVREKDRVGIEWQEAAQMAAQIYSFLCTKAPPHQDFGLLRCEKPGIKK